MSDGIITAVFQCEPERCSNPRSRYLMFTARVFSRSCSRGATSSIVDFSLYIAIATHFAARYC